MVKEGLVRTPQILPLFLSFFSFPLLFFSFLPSETMGKPFYLPFSVMSEDKVVSQAQ